MYGSEVLGVLRNPPRPVAPPAVLLLVLLAVLAGCGGQTSSNKARATTSRLILYTNSGKVFAECRVQRVGKEVLLEPTPGTANPRVVCAGRHTPHTDDVTDYNAAGKAIAKCRMQFIGDAIIVAHRSAAVPPRLCPESQHGARSNVPDPG